MPKVVRPLLQHLLMIVQGEDSTMLGAPTPPGTGAQISPKDRGVEALDGTEQATRVDLSRSDREVAHPSGPGTHPRSQRGVGTTACRRPALDARS
jgi:hypothetical protein